MADGSDPFGMIGDAAVPDKSNFDSNMDPFAIDDKYFN